MANKATQHSPYFAKAKEKYDAGAWNKAMLRVLVEKGKLTAAEYTEITGEEYA